MYTLDAPRRRIGGVVSASNSHIRVCGALILMDGNPGAYLEALRDTKNRLSAYAPDRIQRRREKIDFADFVTKSGGRSPKTVALIGNASVVEGLSASGEPVATFLRQLPKGQYFCKPNTGRNGIGAFRLTVKPGGLLVDDDERTVADVATTLSSEDYVVQEWIAPLQHPDIARFRDGVINTMRLVTFDTDDGPKAVAASLRMAILLKSIDSWTQGGVVAAIDLDKGVLKPFGILKKGLKIVEAHPGSGLAFRDQLIPHFHQAVAMARDLHGKLGGAKSLGWDIALLEDGPCFLETNSPWDILMSAQFNPDLVPAFLAFHLPAACEFAVRIAFEGRFENRAPICRSLGRVLGGSMASGRIERLNQTRLLLTVGGTRQSVRTAAQIFKQKAQAFGARRMAVLQSPDMPARGFDVAAAYPKT